MKLKNKVVISFIIPVFNESKNIDNCLGAIYAQAYDHEKIEIIIADGKSEDDTIKKVQVWEQSHDIAITIIDNPKRIAEFGKALALKKAKGEYLVLLDADNELVGSRWIDDALQTFTIFPDVFGVESRYLKSNNNSLLNNYLTATLHISDPLARDAAIAPILREKQQQQGKTCYKYELRPGYPTGANGFVYSRGHIQQFLTKDTFEEGQISLYLAKQGQAYFAQVSGHGVIHYFVDSFAKYLKKRAKIALKHQTRSQERETWVTYTGARLYLTALGHLTLVYPVLLSLFRMIKYKDILWLLHGPMAFLTTIIYAWNWLINKLQKKKAW